MPNSKPRDNTNLVGKKVKAVPKEPQEIGIDVDDAFTLQLLDAIQSSAVDLATIDNFSNVAQTRESIYSLIDTMAEDDRVSAILETYTEDVIETNEKGQIVWCESSDEDVNKFVNYILDSLNIDKHAYEWVFSLIKYGDLYLQLFRDSDYKDDEKMFKDSSKKLNEDAQEKLEEDINVYLHKDSDHYRLYTEMIANPGEMFELTKHGKTMAYIQAPTNIQSKITNQDLYSSMFYKVKQSDINIYNATDFVHACLNNNNASRCPEEVAIFDDEKDYDAEKTTAVNTFKVRKGQSLLYNQFRTWRQLSLLENSVLLSRLTKSAIIRVLNIDIGDMSKDQAKLYVDRLKQLIEQKSAMQVGKSIQEYTNPGPVENTIYLPVHNGQGNVTSQILGGDYDPKNLSDLDYFQNKFYGDMRVPKQFFNLTDDSTGFNGGSSLTIISSRYGKEIKAIQNIFIQMLTDFINLILIDRGYSTYINRFRLRMQTPVTQEELDRREHTRNQMGVVQDVMSQVNGVVENDIIKLKIFKSLLAATVSDPEVISLLQEEIDAKEKAEEESGDNNKNNKKNTPKESSPEINITNELPGSEPTLEMPEEEPVEEPTEEAPTEDEASYLPSPDEMGLDLTGNA